MKGKCNCGKKAVVEYMIINKKGGHTVKFCEDCKPKTPNFYGHESMYIVDGK